MTLISEETVGVEPGFVERPASWRAILAGVAVGLVAQLLLAILGAAIGLAMVDPTESGNSAATLSIAGAIWWTVSGILSAGIGGLTAGRLCGKPGTTTAAWHGLVAWAATTLIVFYLLTSAVGSIVGGAFNLLGTVASGAAAAMAPAVANATDVFAATEAELSNTMGATDPAAAREAVPGLVRAAFSAEGASADASLSRAADALARATNTTPEAAREQLNALKAEYDQTVAAVEQQAREAADAARKSASTAGIASVIALLLGAVAGWLGGLKSPPPDSWIERRRIVVE